MTAGAARVGEGAASVGTAFAGVQWGRGEVRGQSSETEGEVEEGEIPSFNKLRTGLDAGMTGMCSVGRGDVFSSWLNVFSFGRDMAECVQFFRRCVQWGWGVGRAQRSESRSGRLGMGCGGKARFPSTGSGQALGSAALGVTETAGQVSSFWLNVSCFEGNGSG